MLGAGAGAGALATGLAGLTAKNSALTTINTLANVAQAKLSLLGFGSNLLENLNRPPQQPQQQYGGRYRGYRGYRGYRYGR